MQNKLPFATWVLVGFGQGGQLKELTWQFSKIQQNNKSGTSRLFFSHTKARVQHNGCEAVKLSSAVKMRRFHESDSRNPGPEN